MEEPAPLPRRYLLQAVVGLAIFLAGVIFLAYTLKEPIEAFSTQVVQQLGLPGIFLMVALMDPIPGPGHQVAVFVGFTGGLHPVGVFFAASLGALCSSITCWWVGLRYGQHPSLQAMLVRWKIRDFLQRHGGVAVAIAAIAPIPYAAATLGAGACGVAFRPFLLGSMARPIKIALALVLLSLGWT